MFSQYRLALLLILLAIVGAIRWYDYHHSTAALVAPQPTAKPLLNRLQDPQPRLDKQAFYAAASTPTKTTQTSTQTWAWPARATEKFNELEEGNLFAVHTLSSAPAPAPAQVKVPLPFILVGPLQPPPPPPEPPPPLQVLGTWKKDQDLVVFLAGPNGTLLARTGDILLSDYKVGSITPYQIALENIATKKSWTLTINQPQPTVGIGSSH